MHVMQVYMFIQKCIVIAYQIFKYMFIITQLFLNVLQCMYYTIITIMILAFSMSIIITIKHVSLRFQVVIPIFDFNNVEDYTDRVADWVLVCIFIGYSHYIVVIRSSADFLVSFQNELIHLFLNELLKTVLNVLNKLWRNFFMFCNDILKSLFSNAVTNASRTSLIRVK